MVGYSILLLTVNMAKHGQQRNILKKENSADFVMFSSVQFSDF